MTKTQYIAYLQFPSYILPARPAAIAGGRGPNSIQGSVIRNAVRSGRFHDPWLAGMLARKPRKLVAVALANRMARIAWALMTKQESYRAPAPAAA